MPAPAGDAAITGLLYTVTPQLDTMRYGDKRTVAQPGTTVLPLAEQITKAPAAHPDGTLAAVQPGEGDVTTKVIFSLPELGEKQHTVYVNPYTGATQGQLTTWFGSTPVTTWLDDLHPQPAPRRPWSYESRHSSPSHSHYKPRRTHTGTHPPIRTRQAVRRTATPSADRPAPARRELTARVLFACPLDRAVCPPDLFGSARPVRDRRRRHRKARICRQVALNRRRNGQSWPRP